MGSTEEIVINNYVFDKPLVSDNSGFSKWGIGKRNGIPYFVKEFLAPVYPVDTRMFTENQIIERTALCDRFIKSKLKLYKDIKDVNDGNMVPVESFFRVDAKFYISTYAILSPKLTIREIYDSDFINKVQLCTAIAHAMANLHSKHIVHADIKPDNILIIKSSILRPYIIDFDCSFYEEESPKLGEELNGDMVYLSPEGFMHIAEIESKLSCKMDVFALGILFHQYLTGYMPVFDTNEYQYLYEAVLDDATVDTSAIMVDVLRGIVDRMLLKNPEDRPTMDEVFVALRDVLLRTNGRARPVPVAAQNPKSDVKPTETGNASVGASDNPGGFFHTAGDLDL